MGNKDKSKQNEHDSGMFQVKEISRTNKNDGINLVLPISINGRKIDGIVDTGAQIAIVSEDCFKNLKLPVGCARFFPLKGAGNTTCIKSVSGDIASYKIGNTETKWRLIVANTTDPVIIGLDLLHL
jgi:hypothetical protein